MTESRMETLSLHSRTRASIRLALILVMIAFLGVMAPLGVVLDLQHQVASAGPDGHQHSDSDFCQWVQHHTGSSMMVAAPTLPGVCIGSWLDHPPLDLLLSAELTLFSPSRAPPRL